MALSEVIITMLIGKLLEVMSERAILHQALEDRLSQFIKELEDMLYDTSCGKEPEAGSQEQCKNVTICARDAEDIADAILVESSRRQLPKSLKGRFVHMVAALMGNRDSQAKAQKLIEKLTELLWHYNKMRGRWSNAEPRPKLFGESRGSGSHIVESLMKRRTMTAAAGATVSNSDKPGIIGRETDAKTLMDKLLAVPGAPIIFVTGEEGIGKTALVRSVYDCLQTERHFKCRAWISCSKDMSQRRMLVELIKQCPAKVQKDLDRMEKVKLCRLLLSSLTEHRWLIVLDAVKDFSMDNNWLLQELPYGKTSRVIVTSRNANQSLQEGIWVCYLQLATLDPENSSKFLPKNPLIEEKGVTDKILSKCNGSPLKLILCRGLVLDADAGSSVAKWLDALNQDWSIEGIMCLMFRKLPHWVKPCLLYLCLFPRESEIPTRRIFQLWYAEGLARRSDGDTPEACLQELLNRNIVEVDRVRLSDRKPKICHLPGYWHDYLSQLAARLGLLDVEGEDKRVSRGPIPTMASPWFASCSWDSTTLPPPDAKTVWPIRSYISFQTGKFGQRSREVKQLLKPLQGTKDNALLRVLDLEGVYRPTLPVQFGDLLPNLRYLGLRWTIIDSLPKSVTNLSKLETLDLKHTEVTKLPGSILNLKYLRHLYLNEVSFDDDLPSGNFGSNMETLWGLSVGKGSPMLKVLGKFKGLRKLGLTCHSVDVWEATENITTLLCLEFLRLRSRDLLGQPGKLELGTHMKGMQALSKLYLLGRLDGSGECLGCLPENLRVLTLSMSELQYDPMTYLGQLPHLARLSLLGRSFIGEAITCPESSFPSLQELRLWKLENLREIRLEESSMKSLEELEIRGCKKVLKMDNLRNASKLKRIRLTEVQKRLPKNLSKEHPTLFVISRELLEEYEEYGLPWWVTEEVYESAQPSQSL